MNRTITDKYLLLLAALAPTAMSLIGIVFARSDLRDLKSEVKDLSRKLEEVQENGHRDALEILRQMTSLHERVAIVETKQGR